MGFFCITSKEKMHHAENIKYFFIPSQKQIYYIMYKEIGRLRDQVVLGDQAMLGTK